VSEIEVARELFIHWLNHEYERNFALADGERSPAVAAAGDTRLAIETRALLDASQNGRWNAARAGLEERLAEQVPAAIVVWLPLGAKLPSEEPAASEFVDLFSKAAVKLGPRERGYVRLPIDLLLRKNTDSGGVVSVTGGLNHYWARFTDLVRGTYDLDSSRLHRLPESDEHLQSVIETIAERAGQMKTGEVARIETFDAWTVQRVAGKGGATIVGVPHDLSDDFALDVRRNLRRLIADSGPRLREADAGLRALVLLGYYPRIEQETVTTAMRGYDPSMYAGIDFVCLVADGVVKPLIQAPAAAVSSR
jgi:hypothetical protein